MNAYIRVCEKIKNSLLHKKPKKYELYESNIPTFLRFCHIKDIKPQDGLNYQKVNIILLKIKKHFVNQN